jgi:hypothetical protein
VNGNVFASSDEDRVRHGPAHGACRSVEGAPGRDRGFVTGFGRAAGAALALLLVSSFASTAYAAEDTPEPPPGEEAPPESEPVAAEAVPEEEGAAAEGAAAEEDSEPEPETEELAGGEADAAEDAATVPESDTFDLGAAIEDMVRNPHGSVSVEYRLRSGDDDTDQDLYKWLDLRFGDENTDRLSATIFARSTWDLDDQRKDRREYEFTSTADKYDSSYNVRLYSAYATYRPKNGPIEVGRFGRQYVYAAETFHVDGVWAESAVLDRDHRITAQVYGGVPVHLYESSPSGDWIAGGNVSAQPFRFTRATLDYVHVTDDFEGTVRDDMTALRVWQRATPWLNLYGRASYLHGLRDAEMRATGAWEEQDLMVQAAYFVLLEDKDEEFTTEFDPYYSVLHTLTEYDQLKLRAVKGFGEDIVVEAGADIRNADDEGTYNRDVTRFYAIPTFADLFWERSELSLIGERWSGDGQRIETLGGEFSKQFTDDLEVTVGTDYSMYGYDAFRDRESNHVRSFFYEVRWDITERMDLRLRHVHEEDDEETYDVVTLGLTLAF